MSDRLFDCKFCSEVLKGKIWLSRHLREEHDIRTCPKCQEEIKGQEKYDSHIEEYHAESVKKVKCNKCDLSFTSRGLTYHLNNIHGKLKCPECPEEFNAQRKLDQHITENHVNFRYKCDLCSKEFQKLYNYEEHVACVHGDSTKEFSCEYCDYKTHLMKYLRHHRNRTHLNDPEKMKKFECNLCQKRFIQRKLLRIHQLNFHKAEPTDEDTLYSCEHCTYASYKKSAWKDHVQQQHSDSKFPCNLCGKVFKIISEMDRHKKRIHEGKKDFSCNHCDKCFYSKQHLNIHIKNNHTLNESVPCKICGQMLKEGSMRNHIKVIHDKKSVSQKSKCLLCHRSILDLEKHKALIHGNLEPDVECPQCQKMFLTDKLLKIHLKMVHINRNLKCEQCGKLFKSRQYLKNHLKTHQESEECSICLGKFKDLKRHTFRFHKSDRIEKVFKCEVNKCDKAFECIDYLNKHLKNHRESEECLICHGKFKDLKRHTLRLHHDKLDLLFKCEENECDKRFVNISELKTHLKSHQEPKECPKCHGKFKDLRRHTISRHKKESSC